MWLYISLCNKRWSYHREVLAPIVQFNRWKLELWIHWTPCETEQLSLQQKDNSVCVCVCMYVCVYGHIQYIYKPAVRVIIWCTDHQMQREIGGEEMKKIRKQEERKEKTEMKRTCHSVTHSAGVSSLTSSTDNTVTARTCVCVSVSVCVYFPQLLQALQYHDCSVFLGQRVTKWVVGWVGQIYSWIVSCTT